MALVAHFEHLGVPISIPLDIVEMNFAHTGVALAVEFEAVLKSYSVSERVSGIFIRTHAVNLHALRRSLAILVTVLVITMQWSVI